MPCNENCPCCKSACCCSRTGSADGIACCQADCGDCQDAHGVATSPGQNCDNVSGGRCNTQAVRDQLPIGFCCRAETDECVSKTTTCECARRNGDYTNPCNGTYVPDSGQTWGWSTAPGNPDCLDPSIPCCPCGAYCCLGPGDECCDPAESLCCRGALGETCCNGVCCPAGEICVNGECVPGCTNDTDCQYHYFDCNGVTYGPYDGAINCAAAAAATCPGPPVANCYAGPLEERCCCDGVCQECPCPEPASLLSLGFPVRLGCYGTLRASKRWRKLWQRAARLPRPWAGPGSALKFLLSLQGINASPTCGCNKKALEMDAGGCRWSFVHRREIVAFMGVEAATRKLAFPVALAGWLVLLAISLAAVLKPVRWTLSRRATQGERDARTSG